MVHYILHSTVTNYRLSIACFFTLVSMNPVNLDPDTRSLIIGP